MKINRLLKESNAQEINLGICRGWKAFKGVTTIENKLTRAKHPMKFIILQRSNRNDYVMGIRRLPNNTMPLGYEYNVSDLGNFEITKTMFKKLKPSLEKGIELLANEKK